MKSWGALIVYYRDSTIISIFDCFDFLSGADMVFTSLHLYGFPFILLCNTAI